MMALTLWPEWGWAIRDLGKDVENRGWSPPKSMIGERIAIHGGSRIGGARCRKGDRLLELLSVACTAPSDSNVHLLSDDDMFQAAQSCCTRIVATARLDGVTFDSESDWAVSGQYHWLLADVRQLPLDDARLVCGGKLGLWRLDAAMAAAVAELGG